MVTRLQVHIQSPCLNLTQDLEDSKSLELSKLSPYTPQPPAPGQSFELPPPTHPTPPNMASFARSAVPCLSFLPSSLIFSSVASSSSSFASQFFLPSLSLYFMSFVWPQTRVFLFLLFSFSPFLHCHSKNKHGELDTEETDIFGNR